MIGSFISFEGDTSDRERFDRVLDRFEIALSKEVGSRSEVIRKETRVFGGASTHSGDRTRTHVRRKEIRMSGEVSGRGLDRGWAYRHGELVIRMIEFLFLVKEIGRFAGV
jgi:hypothetical protein